MLTVILHPIWVDRDDTGALTWPAVAVDVIPSLLGFSIGGMTILLAFSYAPIFRKISEDGKRDSFFVRMLTTFFHFIIFQSVSLVTALLASAYDWWILSLIGFWAFAYALASVLAIAAFLYNTGRIYNISMHADADKNNGRS